MQFRRPAAASPAGYWLAGTLLSDLNCCCPKSGHLQKEARGLVAIVICCGLDADSGIKGHKIKALEERVAKLKETADSE